MRGRSVLYEAERIVRNAAITFSSTVLDERTWNAIGGSAGVVGELRDPILYDWTAGPVGQVSYDESDFPVPIPIGHQVTAEVMSLTTSGSGQAKCTVEFKDPNGNVKGKHSETFNFGPVPGAIYTATPRVTIDKEGTWKLHAILEIL